MKTAEDVKAEEDRSDAAEGPETAPKAADAPEGGAATKAPEGEEGEETVGQVGCPLLRFLNVQHTEIMGDMETLKRLHELQHVLCHFASITGNIRVAQNWPNLEVLKMNGKTVEIWASGKVKCVADGLTDRPKAAAQSRAGCVR